MAVAATTDRNDSGARLMSDGGATETPEHVEHDAVLELIRREVSPGEHAEIRDLWKRHSIAEDARDLPGLLSTLTEDCVYELVDGHRWEGHDGAARFYTELLTAFPDIHFDLTDIVIGPQGVCEVARVGGTHRSAWLGQPPSGQRIGWRVIIFFPWDRQRRLFRGERIFVDAGGLSQVS
jgi:predicted ester cyclase